jgi:phospholipid transport system substrate-binding protein
MQLKFFIRLFFILLVLFQISPGLSSVADQDQSNLLAIPLEIKAQDHLKAVVDEILVTIQDPGFTKEPQEQEQIFYKKAMELFDFKTFSMLSLGRKFRSFSNDQKEQFVYYFSKLISQTYFTRLAGKDVHNITITYLKSTPLKPKRNIFRTDISTQMAQGEKQIAVTYRMIKKDTIAWKIYDIKVAGISMAANYRGQYREKISQTPEDIIKELRQKVEK